MDKYKLTKRTGNWSEVTQMSINYAAIYLAETDVPRDENPLIARITGFMKGFEQGAQRILEEAERIPLEKDLMSILRALFEVIEKP